MINCNNYLCIYWKKEKCTLNEIELDISGVCQSCIYFIEQNGDLDKNRQNALKNLSKFK